MFHARIKHSETHFHFVRDKVLMQDIQLQKIHSKDTNPSFKNSGVHSENFKVSCVVSDLVVSYLCFDKYM